MIKGMKEVLPYVALVTPCPLHKGIVESSCGCSYCKYWKAAYYPKQMHDNQIKDQIEKAAKPGV